MNIGKILLRLCIIILCLAVLVYADYRIRDFLSDTLVPCEVVYRDGRPLSESDMRAFGIRTFTAVETAEDAQRLANLHLNLNMDEDIAMQYQVYLIERLEDGKYWRIYYRQKRYLIEGVFLSGYNGIVITLDSETGGMIILEVYD